jgi:hypothetical protein
MPDSTAVKSLGWETWCSRGQPWLCHLLSHLTVLEKLFNLSTLFLSREKNCGKIPTVLFPIAAVTNYHIFSGLLSYCSGDLKLSIGLTGLKVSKVLV